MTTEKTPIVLAFSGGLDTSYCVLELLEQGYEVHTVFVDTGGLSAGRGELDRGACHVTGRTQTPRGGCQPGDLG